MVPVHACRSLALALPVLLLTAPLAAQDDLEARARAIHDRVLTLDTHVDISPANFRVGAPNYADLLPRTQVDLTKMERGGLDGAFLIVYVGQSAELTPEGFAAAKAQALEKFAAVHRLVDSIAPGRAELALTAADATRIHAAGKRVIFIGIENGFPIGSDVGNVAAFHALGGRYMSLAHNGHSQLSDSNTGERDGIWLHNGLSPLGREVIAEMNRVGMMIDISHPSKASMMQTLALTRAPIIASHSGVRALCDHSRNLDDEQLRALAANGGVAQLVAFSGYVRCDARQDPARQEDLTALRKEFGLDGLSRREVQEAMAALPEARRNAYLEKQRQISDRRYPGDVVATVSDFVDHIDYAVKLVGVDHVGIASDFDGGGGVEGWRTAEESLNVTRELVRRGYSEADIAKIWGGNLLRVLAAVERVAAGQTP
ncbi:MAG TPA: dipeptidase [Gemmatimonadales bacterium]|nr:membrane dipeptidase [Gemmatimonadales bacterium]MCB9517787.1 membrane dipeptidase [Gemmatimonadales bacterium]HPF60560.1 dipeptidase [Gemmatimonadales bacterium]HRX18884.1 dipeptidase [Gemmatimonadales bacterium]